jgi:hypothetical protein
MKSKKDIQKRIKTTQKAIKDLENTPLIRLEENFNGQLEALLWVLNSKNK